MGGGGGGWRDRWAVNGRNNDRDTHPLKRKSKRWRTGADGERESVETESSSSAEAV